MVFADISSTDAFSHIHVGGFNNEYVYGLFSKICGAVATTIA